MEDAKPKSQGSQPPPNRGHPMPRRTTPEMSVTLRHHRQARDAATKKGNTSARAEADPTSSPRRNSSGESYETSRSDPKRWFDRSNRNKHTNFDADSMDVDPPFFQKETDSSNEESRGLGGRNPGLPPYLQGGRQANLMQPTVTHSSCADDYRSVIDDLTIENKRLKEELKRYKQFGPDLLRGEKLFEIKVHGLPRRKKRELEATLRDFAASLEGSTETSSPQRKKPSRHAKNIYSIESMSKHPSSSSSHSRPIDSAYASRSTGPGSSAAANSSGTSLSRPSALSRAKTSEQMVESYLQDIPEGLYPQYLMLTDKEKKKAVVKRLEQLFTGTITGKNLHRNQSMLSMEAPPQTESSTSMGPPKSLEPSREATIQALDVSQKMARSRDNLLATNSGGDQSDSRGNGDGSGSGSGHGSGSGQNPSPSSAPPPEQRPTRPHDLDPDRVQIPTDNINYIRHLGIVPPELLASKKPKASYADVSPDADGWVYLNLLCNMAQLHMINVTPDFIRLAVSEKSTKFQLSPDGSKIRWRGGSTGTKFSSDSSGDNSQKSPSADDTDGSNEVGQRKKQKSQAPGTASAPSSKNVSKFGPQAIASSDSFHYKPLFVHRSSSMETSLEGSGSLVSDGQVEDSNLGNTSRWDYSGSGSSRQKKRRHDGAIVYYNATPFCIDLSGDTGDFSPTTYLTTSGQGPDPERSGSVQPEVKRSGSGSSLPLRPVRNELAAIKEATVMDANNPPSLIFDTDSSTSEPDVEFPWCDEPHKLEPKPLELTLEPCGLGGVLPDDHFAVFVTTRRPVLSTSDIDSWRSNSGGDQDSLIARLAGASCAGLLPKRAASVEKEDLPVEIEYLSGRIRRLKPVPLPPPTMFFPPFSTDSESVENDAFYGSEDDGDNMVLESSECLISQRANPHLSPNTYPDGEDLSSNDEEDEVDAHEDVDAAGEGSSQKGKDKRRSSETKLTTSGSAGATAGGEESGYNSSVEDDED